MLISAGLDYPGIGPEHAYLHDIGRAQYVPITDDEAVDAFEYLARTEGIICANDSAHAVSLVLKITHNYSPAQSIIVCLSGRGIFHGMKSYFCQDEYGQIAPVYSISAGREEERSVGEEGRSRGMAYA